MASVGPLLVKTFVIGLLRKEDNRNHNMDCLWSLLSFPQRTNNQSSFMSHKNWVIFKCNSTRDFRLEFVENYGRLLKLRYRFLEDSIEWKNKNGSRVLWVRLYFVEIPLIEITVDLYEGILITTSFACWVLIVSPSQSKIFFLVLRIQFIFMVLTFWWIKSIRIALDQLKTFIKKLTKIKHMRVSRRGTPRITIWILPWQGYP